mmetsp:Transcript_3269/g.9405  ORF Transcript_3269/g.9405 Transcript_3269/m.9405 type:complete len:176 (-) Transcript_3269:1549-2076(-)
MPIEWLGSFLEKTMVLIEEEEGAGAEGLGTVEVHRRHTMSEEAEAAVDMEGVGMVDVVMMMIDRATAGPGMDGKANISRDTVAGVELAIVDGIYTVATTNKSGATTAAGNGLPRGSKVRPTMEIGRCTIIAKTVCQKLENKLTNARQNLGEHYYRSNISATLIVIPYQSVKLLRH